MATSKPGRRNGVARTGCPKQLRLGRKGSITAKGRRGFDGCTPRSSSFSRGLTKMSNSFTETTSTSWFGRLRHSVGGVVIGLVLIVGMVVLLFWNEGRAVTTARSLAEGAGAVVSVGADAVDAANEGKLVHVSGTGDDGLHAERRRFRDQRRRRAARPQCRDVPVEGRIPLGDDQEARRRRGNRHHLHLFQGMGRQSDQFGRVQAAFRTPEPVDGHPRPLLPDPGGQARRLHARPAGARPDRRRPADGDQAGPGGRRSRRPTEPARRSASSTAASISAGTRRRRRSATTASPTSSRRSA